MCVCCVFIIHCVHMCVCCVFIIHCVHMCVCCVFIIHCVHMCVCCVFIIHCVHMCVCCTVFTHVYWGYPLCSHVCTGVPAEVPTMCVSMGALVKCDFITSSKVLFYYYRDVSAPCTVLSLKHFSKLQSTDLTSSRPQ